MLSFSTYLADLSIGVSGVATDTAGNTFVTGYTFSASFPTTAGAVQQPCRSCPDKPDIFVTKLNASGTGLIYSTLLGGSDYDTPTGIAVDTNGNAVVAGYTQSADFTIKNVVMTVNPGNGSQFAFVTSLSADGSKLNYSSLLGGGAQAGLSSTTSTGGVALDSSGNAYISGITDSPVFPVTHGALNLTTPAYPKEVVFVSKFLTTGTLAYSALLGDISPQNGGGGPIGAFGVGVDTTGSAYIARNGGTLWPTTSGAYQTAIPGSSPYAAPFVTKISPTGSSLVYSTFLGSSGAVTAIAVKPSGDAFVTGNSAPADFPTTANAFKETLDGICCSGFLTELNAAGSQLIYSTFFYGSLTSSLAATYPSGLALDGANNIWIVGASSDPALPLMFPLQSTIATTNFPAMTALLSRFDPTGATLTFSSFFGGTGQGRGINGIAIDSNNKAHVAGTTGTDLFTTPGARLASVTPAPPNIQYTFGYAAVIDADVAAPSPLFQWIRRCLWPCATRYVCKFCIEDNKLRQPGLGDQFGDVIGLAVYGPRRVVRIAWPSELLVPSRSSLRLAPVLRSHRVVATNRSSRTDCHSACSRSHSRPRPPELFPEPSRLHLTTRRSPDLQSVSLAPDIPLTHSRRLAPFVRRRCRWVELPFLSLLLDRIFSLRRL